MKLSYETMKNFYDPTKKSCEKCNSKAFTENRIHDLAIVKICLLMHNLFLFYVAAIPGKKGVSYRQVK